MAKPKLNQPLAPSRPLEAEISACTDQYFQKTKMIVEKFGDATVTYAVFMRRPVLAALGLATGWLEYVAKAREAKFTLESPYQEGDWVGAGEPLLYVTGSFYALVELENLLLQKIGAPCVAAYNAYAMCVDLPKCAFIANDSRHCAGLEMAEMMAYAASVGGKAAQKEVGALGFINSSNDSTAPLFGKTKGSGTMPHALIGYAGSLRRAVEMYIATHPGDPVTILPDYFGHEIDETLEICRDFPDLIKGDLLSVRIDTHGGRYMQDLDLAKSYEILERHVPQVLRGYRTEEELKHLVGTGVTAAAIWHMREKLNQAGFKNVKIVASSGFTPAKCKMMAAANAPVDFIGTGSFLPDDWRETFATCDIIRYNGKTSVKVGREFLLPKD
ncbi:MAG: nicotinate phosphoribosyltransferase [Dongiaceae bacterium]